jgi:hypothetical protein
MANITLPQLAAASPITDDLSHQSTFWCYNGTTDYGITRDQILGYKRYANQNANFTISMLANSCLKEIHFKYISGTPIIKVGTTAGGSDIVAEFTSTSIDRNITDFYNIGAQTVYISISGGVVNIKTQILNSDI